jgi:hypothetical protein
MRRNDVVTYKVSPCPFHIYGRVVRFVDPETVVWITGDCDIHLTKVSDLDVVEGYKGRWEHGPSGCIRYFHKLPDGYPDFKRLKYQRPVRWEVMPSLRTLKQRTARVHGRNAWRTPADYSRLVLEAY